jgi:hypothetical protein
VVSLFQKNLLPLINSVGQFITVFTITASYTILFPPTLLRLSLVFPHPKPFIQKHPSLEYAPYLIGLVMIPAFILTGGTAGWMWSLGAVVASVVFLIHSAITMRDALSRAQLFWGLWGMIMGLFLFSLSILVDFNIVSGVPADVITFLSNLGFGLLGVTLAIAILRYRLFDISLIIRRTLQYAVLTVLLALVYFGGVMLLQQVFRSVTGQESDLALVLSTLGIAALFSPLRRQVQAFIDRRFYRRKYDAAHALAEFGSMAGREVELEVLSSQLAAVAQESLQPESISLWLKKKEIHP